VDATERAALLAALAERLAPSAPAVVELMDETAPPTRKPLRIASTGVGDLTYEVWSAGAGAGEWTQTYRVLRAETVLREVYTTMSWADYGMRELQLDASHAGLTCTRIAPDVAVLTGATA
jgi:hypothetical protein